VDIPFHGHQTTPAASGQTKMMSEHATTSDGTPSTASGRAGREEQTLDEEGEDGRKTVDAQRENAMENKPTAQDDDDIHELVVVTDVHTNSSSAYLDSMPPPPASGAAKEGSEPGFFAMHPADAEETERGVEETEKVRTPSDQQQRSKAASADTQTPATATATLPAKSVLRSSTRKVSLSVRVAEPEDEEQESGGGGEGETSVATRSRRNAENEVDLLLQGLPIGAILSVNKIVIKAQAHIRGVVARKAQKQLSHFGGSRARLTGTFSRIQDVFCACIRRKGGQLGSDTAC
jgi:hypothetical protein